MQRKHVDLDALFDPARGFGDIFHPEAGVEYPVAFVIAVEPFKPNLVKITYLGHTLGDRQVFFNAQESQECELRPLQQGFTVTVLGYPGSGPVGRRTVIMPVASANALLHRFVLPPDEEVGCEDIEVAFAFAELSDEDRCRGSAEGGHADSDFAKFASGRYYPIRIEADFGTAFGVLSIDRVHEGPPERGRLAFVHRTNANVRAATTFRLFQPEGQIGVATRMP